MNSQTQIVRPGKLYEVGEDGRWKFFFDSSAIRTFTECEAYFQLHTIDRWGQRGRVWKRDVGSWWSSTMELYYNAVRSGDTKISDMMEFALHCWDEHKMDSFAVDAPASYAEFGGRQGAVLMAGDYFNWSIRMDSTYWKIVSVEEGAGRLQELKVGESGKVVVYYIVKPDLFVIEKDSLMPVDHKTKDTIVPSLIHNFKPHQQMQGYIVAGQELANSLGITTRVDRCVINCAARKIPGPRAKQQERFIRFPVYYSYDELQEWRARIVATAERLRTCIETDTWLWNDSACHKYGGCLFRPVHSVAPAARLTVLKSSYTKVEPWVPYQIQNEDED